MSIIDKQFSEMRRSYIHGTLLSHAWYAGRALYHYRPQSNVSLPFLLKYRNVMIRLRTIMDPHSVRYHCRPNATDYEAISLISQRTLSISFDMSILARFAKLVIIWQIFHYLLAAISVICEIQYEFDEKLHLVQWGRPITLWRWTVSLLRPATDSAILFLRPCRRSRAPINHRGTCNNDLLSID